jgi:hypothetical protein
MKPAGDLDLSKPNVSRPTGGEVQPLSELAAENVDQLAENFAFTDEDQKLLDAVLGAAGNGSAAHNG